MVQQNTVDMAIITPVNGIDVPCGMPVNVLNPLPLHFPDGWIKSSGYQAREMGLYTRHHRKQGVLTKVIS